MTLRLAEVELEDVRRFSGRWRVGPFAPGLNLLAAPNEAGKSTLLEAIRSAILLPHRAQGEEARRLRPLAGGIPTVTLVLADGAGLWRIRKRFAGTAGRAEVVAPDGRSWAGDEAEEEIRRLFGLPPPAAGRGPPARGVWGALWVEQGASLVQPALDRAAQDTLRGVLEAEIDTVTGVRGAARLRAAIARELLAFQTPAGRSSAGRLREVEDRLAALAEEERDLRARRDRAEKALARLAELRARRSARLAERPDMQAEEAVAQAQAGLDALRRAADRRGSLEREAADAARLRDAAAQAWARREHDIARAEAAARQAERLAGNARDAAAAAEVATNRRLALDAAWTAVEAREASRQAEALAEGMRRLRAAEAAAAAAPPAGAASSTLATASILAVIAALLAILAALAQVPPQAGWFGAALALLAAAALGLRAILRARAAARAAEEARRRLGDAKAALALLAPGEAPEQALAAALARAEEARNRAAELRAEAAARGLAIPNEVSPAERDRARAQAEEMERAALRARAEADQAEKAAAEATRNLAEERARDADEALRQRLQRAEEDLLRAARERDANPAPTAEEVAAAEAELHRCEADRKRIADEERRLAVDLAAAETEIRTLEAEGLDDRLAALAEECEQLERERRALERERDGLRLLDRILAEEEERAKAEWVAPVARAVGPWLAKVLGAEAVEIDQGLGVVTIRRSGRAERVEILSAGTQEQIAVLVRLAFADLLERQGKPAPVILDDALVFSDDARIARMFDVLTEAAKTLQIILLTCREDLFRRLPAHALAFERLS
ncbi:AAA family ATPase [Elioraea thermophila]|uniref:AAA family ATPase n=1 Tax=Elioraea thermophila TaxID=2185104 RepID=UPI001300424D|nr:AAA family ATPase [Elioraea thermophila]